MAIYTDKGEILEAGYVIGAKRTHFQVMSDMWEERIEVLVWNPTEGKPNTRYFTYEVYVEVDATEEVLVAYYKWLGMNAYTSIKERLVGGAQLEAAKPVKGKTVKIVAGRDKHLYGKTGTVFHTMYKPYNTGWRSAERLKVGIAFSDEMIDVVKNGRTFKAYKDCAWVWVHNLEVIGAEQEVQSRMADIEEQSLEHMKRVVDGTMTQIQKGSDMYSRARGVGNISTKNGKVA